mmetsp:Transcript_95870/g.276871  ORF Transcript_95870/g.276871 Transcript_95870/m.276871 type:complete len:80 (-) Transcript_95870:928-1167(-)
MGRLMVSDVELTEFIIKRSWAQIYQLFDLFEKNKLKFRAAAGNKSDQRSLDTSHDLLFHFFFFVTSNLIHNRQKGSNSR